MNAPYIHKRLILKKIKLYGMKINKYRQNKSKKISKLHKIKTNKGNP